MINAFKLPRCTPEEQGVSSSSIYAFLEAIADKKLELHGLMVVRRGHVVAEGWWKPYEPDTPHVSYSLTKSVTSIAAGFAVQEGLISVDDDVLRHFPELATPEIRENMRELKIEHLLTMTTGHEADTTRFVVSGPFLRHRSELRVGDRKDRNDLRGFFELPITRAPGTHFVYNSGASLVLGEIIERRAGVPLELFLHSRLFEPLGIRPPQWDRTPRGGNTGGWGIRLTTEDIARLGQFLLQKGVWNGKRILSARWIEEAASHRVDNKTLEGSGNADWEQGYGYQFWRCRHGAYRGDGAFGQFCLVMPEQDAVIAINGGLRDMQAVLDAVWGHLLPALGESTLPINPYAYGRLTQRLAMLELGPKPSANPPFNRPDRLRFAIHDPATGVSEVSIGFSDDGCRFEWRDDTGIHSLQGGMREWRVTSALDGKKIAAKGVWQDERTFSLTAYELDSPHRDILIFRFEGDRLEFRHEHLSFADTYHEFVGTAIVTL